MRIRPEWNYDAEFLADHMGNALSLDAMRSSHPIEQPCPDSDMINQIFDSISCLGRLLLKAEDDRESDGGWWEG